MRKLAFILFFLTLPKSGKSEDKIEWSNKPMQDYSWPADMSPEFVYCKNKTNTSLEVYKNAIAYWQGEGYLIDVDVSIEIDNNCAGDEFDIGKIKLGGEEALEEGYYGVTTRKIQKLTYEDGTVEREVIYAYIKIEKESANNFYIVAHELGHAIGLNHTEDKNSIMHRH